MATRAFSVRPSAASTSRSTWMRFESPTCSAKARTAGPKPWSRSTTAPSVAASPGPSSVAFAPKSRFASRRVRSSTSSGSSVAAIEPIDSISDSRKLDCAVSSSSATSWRRRSVTIRWSAKAPALATAAARPAKASQLEPSASPSTATTAAIATAATSSAPRRLVDDRVAKRNRHGMRARVRFELREDVPHVALHGLLADEEPPGHVRVRHPVGEELEDLPLPRSQHLLAVSGEEGRHQGGVDEALPGHDLLDRLQERLVRRLLEDVALRARLQAPAEQAPLAVRGEDQDRGVRDLLGQDLRRLEAVHARHADVHDHDVGLAPFRQRDGGGAVGSLA